jgi:hypothetical protein
MINIKEFATKVQEMRQAQNEYFRTKQFAAMDRAKKLEREVDTMVKECLTQVDATSQSLFEQSK